MSDTYDVKAESVTITRTVTEDIPSTEIAARLDFWRDELARIEEDYANRKAEAQSRIAELTPVEVDVRRVAEEVTPVVAVER